MRPQWFYHSPISRSECNAWLPVTQFRRRVQARTEHEEDIITTLFNYSCSSSGSSVRAQLPFIESDREDSARYSRHCSREVEREISGRKWTIFPRKYNSAMQNPRQVAPPRQVPHPRAVRAPPRPPLRPLSSLPAPYRPLPILLATSSLPCTPCLPCTLCRELIHLTSSSFSTPWHLTLTFHLWPENLTSLSFECVVFSFLFCLGYGRLVSHCALSPYWTVSTPSSVASAQTSVGTLPPINSHKR